MEGINVPSASAGPVIDPDDGTEDAARLPAGAVLSLVAALVVSVLALRWIAGPGVLLGYDTVRRTPAEISMEAAAAPAATLNAAIVRAPRAAALVPREPMHIPYASVTEAGQRLGMPVVQPAVLPPGVGPLRVSWQPDAPVVTPGDPDTGVLVAWYFDLKSGNVVTLEQGPGIGLSVVDTPPDRHGEVTLPDGRRLVWARGHVEWLFFTTSPSSIWSGDELSVGIAPAGMAHGWRLQSGILSLDELLAVGATVK